VCLGGDSASEAVDCLVGCVSLLLRLETLARVQVWGCVGVWGLGAKVLVCNNKVWLPHIGIELFAIKGFGVGDDDRLHGGVLVEFVNQHCLALG